MTERRGRGSAWLSAEAPEPPALRGSADQQLVYGCLGRVCPLRKPQMKGHHLNPDFATQGDFGPGYVGHVCKCLFASILLSILPGAAQGRSPPSPALVEQLLPWGAPRPLSCAAPAPGISLLHPPWFSTAGISFLCVPVPSMWGSCLLTADPTPSSVSTTVRAQWSHGPMETRGRAALQRPSAAPGVRGTSPRQLGLGGSVGAGAAQAQPVTEAQDNDPGRVACAQVRRGCA